VCVWSVTQSSGVALVILAAGGPEQMGRPKPSLPSRERTLLRRAVETGVASARRPIVVVIGAYAEVVRHELHSLPVTIVYNQNWASGMGSWLRVAMEALAAFDDIEGTVIMLSDHPLVTADAVNRIVKAHYTTGKDIVASEDEDACGEPMYIAKRFFDEMATLDGHRGARCLVDRHLEEVVTVALADAGFDVEA
jgi:molybdenum cofactor cytidylyltransferase